MNYKIIYISEKNYIYYFPTLIPLSGVGTTGFHHVVIKIPPLFLRSAACRQPSLKLEWLQTTANAGGTNHRKINFLIIYY
jgi:hypothetical protein